ncbi:PREDICTED: lipase 3-like, partial [Wasmannia auropunctata]|uniref:lipase 3-like n=1 Tax=Wasmannia auropunctata TaxID=64793 RepID=UPI0005EE396C
NNVTTLDFIGLVERYGYSAEEHYVTTEDGYNLVIHRISESPLFKDQYRRNIVFLQHGFLATSDTWVLIGPDRDLAFLLADQGYDVWIGNFRGNSYCRSHIKMSPRDKDFWQFSYVLNYTKQETLHYIGLSMGNTVLFTLLSTKPEYNIKIKLGICLAPVAIWKKIPSLIQYIHNVPNIKKYLDFNEIYEVASLSSTTITLGRTLCTDETVITQSICAAILYLIYGFDPNQLNATVLPEIFSNFPSGASVQLLHHYYQNMITQKFQAYDYGYIGNYKKYGQMTPITYDLKKVTAPLALFYGANDLLAAKSNVLETYKHLPNVILLEENPYELFTHLDFLWAIDVKTLMYDRLIDLLQKFETWAIIDKLICV